MKDIARLTRRGRRGQVAAVFTTVLFSAILLGALGLLFETGLRGQVSTGEYAKAPVLIGAPQSVPVKEDVDIAVPGRALLPESLVDEVTRTVPDARVVVDQVLPAVLAGRDPLPVTAHPGEALALGDRTVVAGTTPQSAGEVVLPRGLAADRSVDLGDAVDIAFGGEARRFTVVGLTSADDTGVDAADIYLTGADIGRNSARDDQVAAIGVWPGSEGTRGLRELVDRHGAVVWDEGRRGELEVVRQGQAKATLTSAAGAFGGLTVIVTLFTVMALTSLQVRERSRELAMLRVIGATSRQVRQLLVGEIRRVALVAGIIGSVGGPLLGACMVGVGRWSGTLPAGLDPVVGLLPVVIPVVVAVLAAEASVRIAARRVVGRGSPLSGLRGGDEASGPSSSRTRLAAGLAVLALGIAMAAAPWAFSGDGATGLSGLSSLVIALSIGPLSPWVVRSAARIVQGPATRGATQYLALSNVRLRAARVGGVLAPAVLGVTLSCTQLFANASAGAVASDQVDAGRRADLVVMAGPSGIDRSTAEKVAETPGIRSVDQVAAGTVVVRGPADDSAWQVLPVLGADGDGLARYADLDPRGGGPLVLAPDEIALGVQGADMLYAEIGDQVTVVLGDGRTIDRRVATIYRRGLGFGEVVLPLADVRSATASGQATAMVMTLSRDTTEQQGASRVAERLRDHPGVEIVRSPVVSDPEASVGDPASFQVVLLVILWGYIAIAVVSSLVVGNLARRAELTLLHAVGATPAQRQRVGRWEAAFVAVTACVVGIAAAVPGASGLVYALSNGDRAIPAIALGGLPLVVVLTSALVLGAGELSARSFRTRSQRP
ncbi:ABC transporter permease [Streptosporangium lutulentum]|uniref:ABC transport system permease protein n=1 Tax=Streptosporangium lutulentum TaxID=1461250 RepID=A0ABT9QB32_9ACTN|nr:FtsX-like permease family protein [Streptosporangium lutulentum]MDP9843144.1 putative ABC transport system permease protein [Streptosporangium lutulentum]